MDDAEKEARYTRRDAALARLSETRDGCWPYVGGMSAHILVDAYASALATLLNDMEHLDLEIEITGDEGYVVQRMDGTPARRVVWDEETEKWVTGP